MRHRIDLDIVHHVIDHDGMPLRFALILVREGGRRSVLVGKDFHTQEKWGLRRGEIYARQGDSTVRVDSAEMRHRLLDQVQQPKTPSRRRKTTIAIAAAVTVIVAAGTTAFYLAWKANGSEVPFTVVAKMWDSVCGADWMIPRPAQPADYPADKTKGWRDFPATRDGVPASPASMMLHLQGHGDTEVSITDLTVKISARRRPVNGSVLNGGCADQGYYRHLVADLDCNPPRTESRSDEMLADDQNAPQRMRTPIRFPYKISASEAELFEVISQTDGWDCDWHVELAWTSGGGGDVMRIDDNGRPFRTTSKANALEPEMRDHNKLTAG